MSYSDRVPGLDGHPDADDAYDREMYKRMEQEPMLQGPYTVQELDTAWREIESTFDNRMWIPKMCQLQAEINRLRKRGGQ